MTLIKETKKIFDTVVRGSESPSRTLECSFESNPQPINDQLYDKIIFDCIGILFYRVYPDFEKKKKTIHKLLAPNGEFIAGANYQTPIFDGPFKQISEIDKKIERILKCGFELKERIHSENEYIVYKFVKI